MEGPQVKPRPSILGPEYDVGEKVNEIRRKIDRHQSRLASKALKFFTSAGIDEGTLLHTLFLYCGEIPKSKGVNVGLKAARQFYERVGNAARDLAQLADEIDVLLLELANSGIIVHLGSPTAKMRALAEFFTPLPHTLKGTRPEISGRNIHLYALVALAKAATHKFPYRQIADLLNAVDAAGEVYTAKSVEQTSMRFQKANRLDAAVCREEAEELVKAWKEKM